MPDYLYDLSEDPAEGHRTRPLTLVRLRTLGTRILTCLVLGLSPIACGDHGGPDPCKFEGITVTDEQGNIIRNDPDDWSCRSDTIQGQFNHLYPAAPNPFSPRTTIKFLLAADTPGVRLELFAAGCRLVKTINLGALTAGPHTMTLDRMDDEGHSLPAGIYRLVITAGDFECHGDVQLAR